METRITLGIFIFYLAVVLSMKAFGVIGLVLLVSFGLAAVYFAWCNDKCEKRRQKEIEEKQAERYEKWRLADQYSTRNGRSRYDRY